MASPQHLEWLREGVEAWNARRERDDFVPELADANLSGMNLVGINFASAHLENANLSKSDLSSAVIDFCRLENAILNNAILCRTLAQGAQMSGAKLENAVAASSNFWETNFQFTNLRNVDFRMSAFRSTDFLGAMLEGADIRSSSLGNPSTLDGSSFGMGGIFTMNLAPTLNLTQAQINTMIGDTLVRLPEGLHYPAHWPNPELPNEAVDLETAEAGLRLAGSDVSIKQQDPPSGLRSQISFILEHPQLALASAAYSADQIDTAVAAYRRAEGSPNQLPPEMEALLLISMSFREIERLLQENCHLKETITEKDKLIFALEARIDELQLRVHDLTTLIANAPRDSLSKQYIVPMLTGAGAALLANFVMFSGDHIAASTSELSRWAFYQPESLAEAEFDQRPMPRPRQD